MAKDPELRAHLEWLGYVQPTGVVVSPHALLAGQAQINQNIIPLHTRFLEHLAEITLDGEDKTALVIRELPAFLTDILNWRAEDLVEGEALTSLDVVLENYHETLRPTYAVKEIEPVGDDASPWLMLIQVVETAKTLDKDIQDLDERQWQADLQARFERLLRETKVPIGLLFNGTHLRLVYAPRGETSGHLTFNVAHMAEVGGRSIFAALCMLLNDERLFALPRKQRLPALLSESRKYQNVVSTKLSQQVLNALYELLRGFQAADDHSRGELLREALRQDPNHVYGGLLNVLLRLVFTLYAEDRALMPNDPVYVNYYSVTGLFERLRADANRYVDTMDQRYGAWAQLLSLFRLIYDGANYGNFKLPARHGHLFNPDRYTFLEGRAYGAKRQDGERLEPPMVSDGVVFRVLRDLLILDGERLSYRSLDVEQIGSVYETIMGFSLEVATGRSIAIKPTKPHGAPLTINLEELLSAKGGQRAKWIKEKTDQNITGEALRLLQEANTPEEAVAALDKKVSPTTRSIIPAGAMIFQPSDERRRSGSHYTPRSLTEPIVRTTLGPILEQLGEKPKPEQILELKVCDPAMGSGAFLVESDRQLADELVKAWHHHNCVPTIPPDEDEVLVARRLVAQRCLYGVDKNPMATDLAKLSLWLATLAKDHAFTFLDHALRCGDSLVGLSRKRIAAFDWGASPQIPSLVQQLSERIERATKSRSEILAGGDDMLPELKKQKLKLADDALEPVRLAGNACIAAFFSETKDKKRQDARSGLARDYNAWISTVDTEALKRVMAAVDQLILDLDLQPFHWEIEFPEVFLREGSGFDAFIGNPPFAGKNTLINSTPDGYVDWLKVIHEESHGNADLVAHFFRRAFSLLRHQGAFGLIATNTIGQGDTRATGLRCICTHGGTIFNARKRFKWPGQAAVVVSVVHIFKGTLLGPFLLDGKVTPSITAYLFHAGGHETPASLTANANKAFKGCEIGSLGFLLTPSDEDFDEIFRITDPRHPSSRLLKPYLCGEDIYVSPLFAAPRFVLDVDGFSEEMMQQIPLVRAYLSGKVRPDLLRRGEITEATRDWWHFRRPSAEFRKAARRLTEVLVIPQTGNALAFALLDTKTICSHTVIVFSLASYHAFCSLQSRAHTVWVLLFCATMKDDARYMPSDCFETFPFPKGFETNPALESAGKEYYEFRAALMVRNNEGLTKTYNRFHDPEERSPDILKLRELHAVMDRVVLDAYGWTDLQPTCDFFLDYEDEEDEDETPARGRGRKKPWRYRWPDDFRDEVLARLLDLNRQYAEQERLSGATAEKKAKRTRSGKISEKGGTHVASTENNQQDLDLDV